MRNTGALAPCLSSRRDGRSHNPFAGTAPVSVQAAQEDIEWLFTFHVFAVKVRLRHFEHRPVVGLLAKSAPLDFAFPL